jgi:hypothetical protein
MAADNNDGIILPKINLRAFPRLETVVVVFVANAEVMRMTTLV